MLNIARLAAVLVVFVTAVAGVVWTTATEERRIGQRQFDRSGAAHELVDALLAR